MKNVMMVSMIVLAATSVGLAAPLQTETETYGPAAPSYSDLLTFNQYSGANCGLVRITMRADSTGGSVSLDNEGEDPATATYDFGIRSTLASTTLASDVVLNALNSGSASLAADDGDLASTVEVDGLDSALINGQPVSDQQILEFTGTDMAPFLGSGTFDVDAYVTSIASITGGVNFTNIVSDGGGLVTVEYFVPEPATMGLLTLGGLGLLVRARRRRRAA